MKKKLPIFKVEIFCLYKDRMLERHSGGQQQRVAFARALVIKPYETF